MQEIAIPRVSVITKQEFDLEYLEEGLPVVIEDAMNNWPSLQWTLDSIRQRAGENKVYVRSNTNCDDYKRGTKYNIRETTLKEYIDDLEANNHRSKNSYLAVQNMKKAFPQLLDEIRIPEYVEKLHGGPFLWIARKGHYEYCHQDPDEGMLLMMSGVKEIRLFPCDPEPLYPNPLGSKGRTVQTSVNIDDPDLEKHPLFSQAVCHRCTLNAGEMLYIPAFWWHQVTSTEMCISLNIFWGNSGNNTYLTRLMKPSRWKAFSHWLLNVIEQNRTYPCFVRILSRLRESIYHFLLSQWHEEATDEQLEILEGLVKEYLQIKELPNEPNQGRNPTTLVIRGLLWRS